MRITKRKALRENQTSFVDYFQFNKKRIYKGFINILKRNPKKVNICDHILRAIFKLILVILSQRVIFLQMQMLNFSLPKKISSIILKSLTYLHGWRFGWSWREFSLLLNKNDLLIEVKKPDTTEICENLHFLLHFCVYLFYLVS